MTGRRATRLSSSLLRAALLLVVGGAAMGTGLEGHLGPVASAQASGLADPSLPVEARAAVSPDARYTVWISPGPDPAIWLAVGDQPRQHLLSGQSEHFGGLNWSPDGLKAAFVAVPLGSGTDDLGVWHVVDLPSGSLSTLGAAPAWIASPVSPPPAMPLAGAGAFPEADAGLAPPATIRVAHHPSNSCRSAPAWSVVVLPFEEYVARVLPAEVYASWPPAAIQAQAIAVRTYAWWKIRNNPPGMTYDITDWAIDQVMCDTRYSSTDAAAAATAGYYLEYDGVPIFSQYSAENSHPTLDGGKPYLRPVVDPVGLGRVRSGHGRGLSQWGAYRWAATHHWNATQIVTHYYTGARVVSPSGNPLLSILTPWPDTWLRSAKAYLSAHASGELATGLSFCLPNETLAGAILDGRWAAVWSTANAPTGKFDISAGTAGQSHVVSVAGVDVEPPTGQVTTTAVVTGADILVQVTSAADTGGSGLTGVTIGGDWRVDAPAFIRQSGGGAVVADPEASQGVALLLPAGGPSAWGAEEATVLDTNMLFQAHVRSRIDPSGSMLPALRVEIADAVTGVLLGFVDSRSGDAPRPGAYWESTIDFWLSPEASGRVRVTVRTSGESSASIDRVRILPAPRAFLASLPYQLPGNPGDHTVVVKLFDGAGNPSADLVANVTLAGDTTPPDGWELIGPAGWVTDTAQPIVTARASDNESGLSLTSAAARSSSDGGSTWSHWAPVSAESLGEGTGRFHLAWPGGECGGNGRVQFGVLDRAGWESQSPIWQVRVDLTPPTAWLSAPAVWPAWTPIPVTWVGSDDGSGVASFDLRVSFDRGAWGTWLVDVAETSGFLKPPGPGFTHLQVRAHDVAGHVGPWSAERAVRVGLDHQYLPLSISP